MPRAPQESDLLTEFEQRVVKGDQRDYWKVKRNNLYATIQSYPRLWQCFQNLDGLMVQEYKAFETNPRPDQALPLCFFFTAHGQVRNAVELAFSCCMNDAFAIMRNAIESTAYGLKVLREPQLADVWLSKGDGPSEKKAFDRAFRHGVKEKLFPSKHGLERLYLYYEDFSEGGTHSNIRMLSWKFEAIEDQEGYHWKIIQSGGNLEKVAVTLVAVLNAAHLIENAVYKGLEKRLQFVVEIQQSRRQQYAAWSKLSKQLLTALGLKPLVIL